MPTKNMEYRGDVIKGVKVSSNICVHKYSLVPS